MFFPHIISTHAAHTHTPHTNTARAHTALTPLKYTGSSWAEDVRARVAGSRRFAGRAAIVTCSQLVQCPRIADGVAAGKVWNLRTLEMVLLLGFAMKVCSCLALGMALPLSLQSGCGVHIT